jgi:hypothetical protein
VVISSRTPEGEKNRCAVCGHVCRIEPSCLSPDATCPSCGNLLWFAPKVRKSSASHLIKPSIQPESETPAELKIAEENTGLTLAELDARPKRPQNPPPVREPQVQTDRLVRRLIRRAEVQWGQPDESILALLAEIREPRQAERLLMLLHSAKSWSHLIASWKSL